MHQRYSPSRGRSRGFGDLLHLQHCLAENSPPLAHVSRTCHSALFLCFSVWEETKMEDLLVSLIKTTPAPYLLEMPRYQQTLILCLSFAVDKFYLNLSFSALSTTEWASWSIYGPSTCTSFPRVLEKNCLTCLPSLPKVVLESHHCQIISCCNYARDRPLLVLQVWYSF